MKRLISFRVLDESFIKTTIVTPSKKSKVVSMLWEKVSTKSFNLYSYFNGLNSSSMAKALDTEPRILQRTCYW